MKLHNDKTIFTEAIRTTANDLGMAQEFVEKDYWICQILQCLSRHPMSDRIVWKGGTSLSKGYGLVKRFSSDVDFAILAEGLSQNQQKKLVMRIGKETTAELSEIEVPDKTIKNNRFRKTYHEYESVLERRSRQLGFLGNHVVVEINTYGNPYPYERKKITSFIAEMMERRGLGDMIDSYDMEPFELNILDKRRTLCEKVVSLLRFSFEEDPAAGLSSKIRHFYDIHFLMQDYECREYLRSAFPAELKALVEHDKAEFDRPPLWKSSPVLSSPLLTDFDEIWHKISSVYRAEVGALSYGEIPSDDMIASTFKTLLPIIGNALK